METIRKEVIRFFDRKKNISPIEVWIIKQEKINKKVILDRIRRVSDGNYGDYKSVGNNILN